MWHWLSAVLDAHWNGLETLYHHCVSVPSCRSSVVPGGSWGAALLTREVHSSCTLTRSLLTGSRRPAGNSWVLFSCPFALVFILLTSLSMSLVSYTWDSVWTCISVSFSLDALSRILVIIMMILLRRLKQTLLTLPVWSRYSPLPWEALPRHLNECPCTSSRLTEWREGRNGGLENAINFVHALNLWCM